jgi:hypothetical protein
LSEPRGFPEASGWWKSGQKSANTSRFGRRCGVATKRSVKGERNIERVKKENIDILTILM